jgi:hypothetical protein
MNMGAHAIALVLLSLIACSDACIQMYGTVQEGLVSTECLDLARCWLRAVLRRIISGSIVSTRARPQSVDLLD